MKVLIAEDEQPARERLRQLFRAHPDLEVVGEAQDGEEALQKIVELKPDLVFLDIQMPGCTGLEVAASLPSPGPRIIFCTAYDQYAIDAFELHAVDYLLKPVSRARLAQALERARQAVPGEVSALLQALTRAGKAAPSRFLARRGARFRVVPQEEVLFFSSQEGLTRLCATGGEYWMQPSLTELEERLDPASFCRLSRSAIVNLDAVREVIPLVGGYGQVVLKEGRRLEVSRRRLKELMERLAGK